MKSLSHLPIVLMLVFSNSIIADQKQNAIDLAVTKLSQTLNIDKATINIISTRAVTWRNSGLGCGQANTQHNDVITAGYQIKLYANKQNYLVHTGRNRAIICHKPLADAIIPPVFDSDI